MFYYKSLNVICEASKKLLMIKSVNFFNTLYLALNHYNLKHAQPTLYIRKDVTGRK